MGLPQKPEVVKDARPVTRLSRMMQGNLQMPDIVWPGLVDTDGSPVTVKLKVLTCDQIQWAHARAIVRFTEVLKIPIDSPHTIELFEDEVRLQVLFDACRDPADPKKPFAVDDADMRENTTAELRELMFDRYVDHARKVDPALEELSDEETKEVIAALKKKDRVTLVAFGSRTLASFLLSMDSPQ